MNDAPTSGAVAWATDYEVLLVGNGTNWYVDSSYLTLQPQSPDPGVYAYSNRLGYGQTYLSNKEINHSTVGWNQYAKPGAIRYNPTGLGGTSPSFQVYFSGAWNNLVANLNLSENSAVLEQQPVGYVLTYDVYSGNADELGNNGLPLVQGYQATPGAYPLKLAVDGGSF